MILNYRTNRRLSSRARCRLDWQPRTNKISKNYEMIEQTFDRSVKSVTSCFYSNLRKKIEFVCVCVCMCVFWWKYLLNIFWKLIFFLKKKRSLPMKIQYNLLHPITYHQESMERNFRLGNTREILDVANG